MIKLFIGTRQDGFKEINQHNSDMGIFGVFDNYFGAIEIHGMESLMIDFGAIEACLRMVSNLKIKQCRYVGRYSIGENQLDLQCCFDVEYGFAPIRPELTEELEKDLKKFFKVGKVLIA